MRIFLLVGNERTYQPIIYERIIQGLPNEVVGIGVVPYTSSKAIRRRLYQFMWNFYGPFHFFRKGLQVAWCTFLNKLEPLFRFSRPYSMHELARKYRIPCIEAQSPNSPDFLAKVRALEPDLILNGQGHLLKREIINLPRIGIINKHAGLLPKYRGVFPIFWAMLNGEREFGITIHYINEKWDDGDIIVQERHPIHKDDTFNGLYGIVKERTAPLYLKALECIEQGESARPNPAEQGSYFSYPTRDDIREFMRLGNRTI